jgi:PAS domain S-box-containing protein
LPKRPVSFLILIVGILLSALAGFTAYSVVDSKRLQTDRFAAETLVEDMQGKILVTEAQLRALRGFFTIKRNVTDNEFENFAAQLSQPSHVRALQLVQFLKAGSIEEYARQQRGFRKYPFTPTERNTAADVMAVSGDRDHAIIEFIYPMTGNQRALGLDISSNEYAKDALARAVDHGNVATSDPFALVQNPDESAFQMFLPVARHDIGEPSQVQFNGAVGALISINELVNVSQTNDSIIARLTNIDSGIVIYASTIPIEGRPLVDYKLQVGDRSWNATIAVPEGRTSAAAAMLVFGLGSLLTLVALGAYEQSRLQERNRQVGSLLDRSEHARAIRDAAYTSLFNGTGTANAEIEVGTGFVVKANLRLMELTGLEPGEIEGRLLNDLFDARDQPAVTALVNSLSNKAALPGTTSVRLRDCQDKVRWMLVSAGEPIENDAGGTTASLVMQDITVAKESSQARDLLVRELAHRVRNTMQLVSSLADQTAARSSTVDDYRRNLQARLRALNVAQDALFEVNWGSVKLDSLVSKILSPFDAERAEDRRITSNIAPVMVTAQQAQMIALAIHELASNAAKYGALSHRDGKIELEISIEPDADMLKDDNVLKLRWSETSPSRKTSAPSQKGFGTIMLEKLLARQYGGQTRFTWRKNGLLFEADLPISSS